MCVELIGLIGEPKRKRLTGVSLKEYNTLKGNKPACLRTSFQHLAAQSIGLPLKKDTKMNLSALATNATNPNVFIQNGKAVTTSQVVSEYFCKQHKDVLRKIESLECSSEFTERNLYSNWKSAEAHQLRLENVPQL